jgi:hypothetical protein
MVHASFFCSYTAELQMVSSKQDDVWNDGGLTDEEKSEMGKNYFSKSLWFCSSKNHSSVAHKPFAYLWL